MRQHLKDLVQRNSQLFNPIWPILYPVIRRRGGEIASDYDENLTAFAKIYAENLWENPESRSGWGSTLAHTTTLRRHLAKLLVDMNVKTFSMRRAAISIGCRIFRFRRECTTSAPISFPT